MSVTFEIQIVMSTTILGKKNKIEDIPVSYFIIIVKGYDTSYMN